MPIPISVRAISAPWPLLALLLYACGTSMPPVSQMPRAGTGSARRQIPVDTTRTAYTERGGFPEYVIGRGDKLRLTLRDVELTTETVTVRPDGHISFSLLENVRAAGRTPRELDEALTAALTRYLRTPKIDVEVEEYDSQVVSILGAIEQGRASVRTGQGRYRLKGKTTILDLILVSGGPTADAQLDNVKLIRHDQSYDLDLQRVLATGDQSDNVILQGGDIIIVPGTSLRSKKVVVLGEVTNPSVYMFPDDAHLMEALSQAGGLGPAALRDDIRLIRVVDGKPRMFSINFERLANQGDLQQNVALRTDDIIYVPRSFIGDVNDVITKIEPLLNILLLPATYRDLYTTGGGLRIDTGEARQSGGFIRTLPGTGKRAGKASSKRGGGNDDDEDDSDR